MTTPYYLGMEKEITNDKTEAAWLAARDRGLGASDLARVWSGHGYEVWAEKRGLVPGFQGSGYTETGTDLEPIVAARYQRRTPGSQVFHGDGVVEMLMDLGVPFEDYGPGRSIIRHKDHPWLSCTPDCLIVDDEDGLWLGEIKVHEGWMAREWADGAPEKFTVQVETALAILRSHLPDGTVNGAKLLVQIGYDADAMQIFVRPGDDGIVAKALRIGGELWQRIESGEEPPADWNSIHAFNAVHPQEEGKVIDLGPEAGVEIDGYEDATARAKAAKADVDERKAALRTMLGDAEIGVLPDGRRVTYKADKRGARTLRITHAKR